MESVVAVPLRLVITLAGGTARRLGGVSKPDLQVGGMSLLQRQLGQVKDVCPLAQVVVVAPPTVVVPKGVTRVLEDPPFGGPVAGFAAGLSAAPGSAEGLVGLATCDAPLAPANYGRLVAALGPDLDGAVPTTGEGEDAFAQYALGVYRRESLAKLLGGPTRNVSVKGTFSPAKLAFVPDREGLCTDVDTWEDVETLEGLLNLH